MRQLKNIILIMLIVIFIINLGTINSYAEVGDIEIFENNNEPTIYSEAAIVIEKNTGKILYEKNSHDKKYPASTTKILTAILAIENCDLNETVVASSYAVNSVKSGYTKADIQVGEEFTVRDLIKVMMIQSANEAATMLAEHISGSEDEFAKLMNEKAKELGCTDSNFVNANGMHDENHYTTAYDLALIARYAMKNAIFREIVKLDYVSLPNTDIWNEEMEEAHGKRIFYNTNSLLKEDSKYYYPYAIGIKAGFTTPAKNCLVSASNKDGFEVITVVLHAENTAEGGSARYEDTINLFNYAYDNYTLEEIKNEYPRVEVVSQTEEIDINHLLDTISVKSVANEIKNDSNFRLIFVLEILAGVVLLILAIVLWNYRKIRERLSKLNRLYKFDLNFKK